MPGILGNLIPTTTTILLAPVLLFLCLILFPFAVITTYIAFVALAVRAVLVHAQVVTAIIRYQLGLDNDYTSTSAWAPRFEKEELQGFPVRRTSSRRSMSSAQLYSINSPRSPENLSTLIRTIPINADLSSSQELATSSSASSTASPISPGNSRPGSTHSSFMTRDYEGVGGWYALPTHSALKPENTSTNLEWLVTNARLELPNADPSYSTRPRTPEERNRSSSIGGLSHRSMVSLTRRHHRRTATVGSADMVSTDELSSIEPNLPRKNGFLERSKSGILVQPEMNNSEGPGIGDRQGKHRSMISLSEKGSRLAYKLTGWKSLGLKKKAKNESISSPDESTNEESKTQDNGLRKLSEANRRKTTNHELSGGTSTPIGSAPGSVEGVDTGGGLTMWLDP